MITIKHLQMNLILALDNYNPVAVMVDCINYLIIWFSGATSFSVTC